jgi:hypothetical protein
MNHSGNEAVKRFSSDALIDQDHPEDDIISDV